MAPAPRRRIGEARRRCGASTRQRASALHAARVELAAARRLDPGSAPRPARAVAPSADPDGGSGAAASSGRGVGMVGVVEQLGFRGDLHQPCPDTSPRPDARCGAPPPRSCEMNMQGEARSCHLQIAEQVEDLRLHRDVERRDRLVADDQARGSTASARAMRDALALAAAEGMRDSGPPRSLPAAPTSVEQLATRAARRAAARQRSGSLERLGDDVAARHVRGLSDDMRILEHHLHRGGAVAARVRSTAVRRCRALRERMVAAGRRRVRRRISAPPWSCRSRSRRPRQSVSPAERVKLTSSHRAHACRASTPRQAAILGEMLRRQHRRALTQPRRPAPMRRAASSGDAARSGCRRPCAERASSGGAAAAVDRRPAARMEAAAPRQRGRGARHRARNDRQPLALARVVRRHRAEQQACV